MPDRNSWLGCAFIDVVTITKFSHSRNKLPVKENGVCLSKSICSSVKVNFVLRPSQIQLINYGACSCVLDGQESVECYRN